MEELVNKNTVDSSGLSDELPQTAVTIDHVTFLVKNLEATAQFYEKVFGMHVERKDPRVYYIRVGNSFLGLIEAGDRPAGFHHFCLGLKNFDAEQVAEKLKELGLAAEGTVTPRINDPDGIHVQFGPTTYARSALAREN